MIRILIVYMLLQCSFYMGESSCYNMTSCVDCVGTSLSPTNNNCQWCAGSGQCINEADTATVECPGASTECTESYYTIIFIVVVTALGCLCFGTCCLRKIRLTDEDGNFISPLFPQFVATFRNSYAPGEYEWMCIICGFDNKPRTEHCTLCGTSHQFSTDYKTEKMSKRKIRRAALKKDIKIPAEAQISCTSVETGDVLGQSLSQHQRAEIFNYRRLNQLTLRQKSARRRRMWQRVTDEDTGEVRWMRSPVAETKVGKSLFGYSPSHSFDDTYSRYCSSASDEDSFQSTAGDPLIAAEGGGSVSHIGPKKKHTKKQRDSFDDVVVSGSPGFTSVFGNEGELQWEQVESGKAATTNTTAPAYGSSSSKMFSPGPSRMLKISFNDLEAAAVMSYKDKQLWFLRHLTTLQRPWNEGYVRFEVSKKNVLHDSCKCMLQLRKVDLHKWMRIQFAGSSGIDAGGLEREWFALVAAELLDPKNGLFICSSASDSTPGTGLNAEEDPEGSGDGDQDGPMGSPVAASGSSGTFHINPLSAQFNPNHLEFFQFAGRFFGKGILEQQVINAPLSLPLRKQLLSLPITFSDLEFVDDELYRNLMWLQNTDNVESLDLDFTVTYTYTPNQSLVSSGTPSNSRPQSLSGSLASSPPAIPPPAFTTPIGKDTQAIYETPNPMMRPPSRGASPAFNSSKKVSISKELKPNGANILVTDANKAEYLQLKLRDRMLDSIKPQLEHFLRGFYEVIPGDLLSVFDYQELDLLMCGLQDLDMDDWKRHTEYLGEYHAAGSKHRVIKWFWSVMESFDNEERVRLLQVRILCCVCVCCDLY